MEDFNYILNTGERVRSAVRFSELHDFQHYVNNCGIDDAKYSGNFYT